MKENIQSRHNTLTFCCLLVIFPVINSQQCGRAIMTKIIHGQEVTRGTYPWMVVLVPADNPSSVHCGGALITRHFVVTAKHCTKGSPTEYKVLAGTTNLKSRDPSIKLYSIEKYIQYNGSDDIALVKTHHPVKLDDYVQPICLPPGNKVYSEVQAVIAGYGEVGEDDNGDSKSSDTLMSGVVNTTSKENCNDVMARYEYSVDDNILCAGSYGGQPDHCYGDSGGPLMYFESSSSTWQLIGVITAAFSCANVNDYSYYANVTYYRDWIISNSDYKD